MARKITFEGRLSSLAENLVQIRRFCETHRDTSSNIDSDGSLCIKHPVGRPSQFFLIRVYPPADKKLLRGFFLETGIDCPGPYLEMLQEINGFTAFGFSMFGVPLSRLTKNRLLDRSKVQCLDVSLANRTWKVGYKVPQGWFHFGSRNFSDTEKLGYFLENDDASIHAVMRESGKTIKSWTEWQTFLAEELAAAEALFRDK